MVTGPPLVARSAIHRIELGGIEPSLYAYQLLGKATVAVAGYQRVKPLQIQPSKAVEGAAATSSLY
jgi:hypothetical protein